MTYYIGQIFENGYPPEAAVWCNNNHAVIVRDGSVFAIRNAIPASDGEVAKAVRVERNRLLSESDKYVLCDYPITYERKEAFKAYRQMLRDIPEQMDFPYKVIFPEKP